MYELVKYVHVRSHVYHPSIYFATMDEHMNCSLSTRTNFEEVEGQNEKNWRSYPFPSDTKASLAPPFMGHKGRQIGHYGSNPVVGAANYLYQISDSVHLVYVQLMDTIGNANILYLLNDLTYSLRDLPLAKYARWRTCGYAYTYPTSSHIHCTFYNQSDTTMQIMIW